MAKRAKKASAKPEEMTQDAPSESLDDLSDLLDSPPEEPLDDAPDDLPDEPPAEDDPFAWPNDDRPLVERVEEDLRAGGALSRSLPDYEERESQVIMARRVAEALERNQHLVVEAGTGTGKGLAYLLPIVRDGKVALLSTANKALQEQLFYKDIPFTQRHVQPFEAALVKGMGNYLCLDRYYEELSFQSLAQTRGFVTVQRMLDDDDWNGDLDLIPESLPTDVRAKVAADSDQCAWRA